MAETPTTPVSTATPNAAPPATSVPPTATMVTLTIDGKTATVPKGTNILEAAKTVGVDISFFCYHAGLSSPAVCRQCLVEVKGQPKLVPSCFTPVADKMEVHASSERTLQARAQMLEFTLVNHPVDCPICDKAGECSLQKMYHEWDHHPSRITQEKQHKPKVVDLGPQIVLDAERCILCTRCIRVCDEVAKDHQLEMAYRGDREQLTTAPGKQLDNPYSMNTVDVCPVGALTAKDFRFSMRAWELNTTPSVCAGCATGCNIEVHHKDDRVYRLVPRENQAVNKFWMCDEGRLTYHPLTRGRIAGGRLSGEPAPVAKVVAFAADRLAALQKSGAAGALGVVLSAQATNEDNYRLVKVAEALGVERIYVGGHAARPERADDILRHADVNPNSAGARAVAGGKAKGVSQLSADLASGQLKALWVLADELELDAEALEALPKLDLVIAQSAHDNALTELAHAVLPAAAWAEVHGTFTNAKGLVQRVRQAVEAPGDAQPHHQWATQIGRALGVELPAVTPRAIFSEMVKAIPEFNHAQFGREAPLVQLRFAGSRG